MDELERFLTDRGLSTDVFATLIEQKIDLTMLANMNDKQLADIGISRLGDQIAVQMFCGEKKSDDSRFARKSELLSRLRSKRQQLESKRQKAGSVLTGRKKERRVDVGWLHYDNSINAYVQVRQKSGGGTRKLLVHLESTFGDLLETSKGLFFPSGLSQKGLVDDFEFSIRSFDHSEINLRMTVGDLLDCTKVKLLHVYLTSTPKPTNMTDDTQTSTFMTAETTSSVTVSEGNSGAVMEFPDLHMTVDSDDDCSTKTEMFVDMGTPTIALRVSRNCPLFFSHDQMTKYVHAHSDNSTCTTACLSLPAAVHAQDDHPQTQLLWHRQLLVIMQRQKQLGEVMSRHPLFINHQQCPTTTSASGVDQPRHPYEDYVSLLSDDDFPQADDEEAEVQCAIQSSLSDARPVENRSFSLEEILAPLRALISHDKGVARFNISRNHIWEGARRSFLRKGYSAEYSMSVKFTDDIGVSEGAVDEGGPRREFLQMVIDHLASRSPLFIGSSKHINPSHTGDESDDYFVAGLAIAVSIVHEGPAPSFMSKELYRAVVGDPATVTVPVESLPDVPMKTELIRLLDTDDIDEVNTVLATMDWLSLAGVCQHVSDLGGRNRIVQYASKWLCFGRTRPALERLKDGLMTLGVLDAMKNYPDVFEPVMCTTSPMPQTVETMTHLFTPQMSILGSNRRLLENEVYAWWLDLLEDINDGNVDVTYDDVLFFATGLRQPPPGGFRPTPSVTFLHDSSSRFPHGHTCSCTLLLPTSHRSYEDFCEGFVYGIKNSQGFGYA